MNGRVVATFNWWDDAVTHAHWLAARTLCRYRVYRLPNGLWRVRVAVVSS